MSEGDPKKKKVKKKKKLWNIHKDMATRLFTLISGTVERERNSLNTQSKGRVK